MFDWSDYLELADMLRRDLQVSHLPEARFRCAISRAYYAAFHYAMTRGSQDVNPFIRQRNGRDHQSIIDHFQSPPSSAASLRIRHKIGADLERLRDYRNEADYEDNLGSPAESLAQSVTAIATNTIRNLQRL